MSGTVRLSRAVLLALSLGIAGALAGCTSTPTSESTGEYLDNTLVTAKVRDALAQDPLVKSHKFEVETYKGTVQLSGFVDSAEQKTRAEQVTRQVEGVKSVRNDLVILKKGETAGQYLDSTAITAKVKAKIAETPSLSSFAIEVTTVKGVVQLSGFVDTSAQRQLAGKVAKSVKGVKSVKNSLVVKAG